jgi:hypothetical protein
MPPAVAKPPAVAAGAWNHAAYRPGYGDRHDDRPRMTTGTATRDYKDRDYKDRKKKSSFLSDLFEG